VIGTIVNVTAILVGGVIGLAGARPLSLARQNLLKAVLGLATVICGLVLTLASFHGPFLHLVRQFVIVMVSLVLGKFLGRLLHLQKASNRIGQFARERMARATPENPNRFADGFAVCAALFCAAPLGWLGAIHDGLAGYFWPLAIKAVMDGLAAMGFVVMFGWGVLFSAVPVLLFQGTLTLLCLRFLRPFLEAHQLLDPVNATGGLVIFSVSLLIFEARKVEVADYLPALAIAPVLAHFLR